MKKFINIAFIYAILGISCGVFYREFTKFLGFTGKTTLAFTHLHYIVLGSVMFLIVGIFSCLTDLEKNKKFKPFMIIYNIGLNFVVIMFIVKGIFQSLEITLDKTGLAIQSGVSGLAHITMTIGIVFLFLTLKSSNITFKKD